MKYLLFIIISALLLTGCSLGENMDKAKEIRVIGQMKPSEENQYHLYAYFDFDGGPSPQEPFVDEDENQQYQYDVYNSMNVELELYKLHVFSIQGIESGQEQIEVLNIEEFPTFVLLDKNGVMLQTSDMNSVAALLRPIPDIEDREQQ